MNLKKHLLLILILTLVYSCGKKPVTTDTIFKYGAYISYTTSGIISVNTPITISLSKDVDSWEADQELNPNLISTVPHIQGKLKRLNKYTLVFIPDESLEPATLYGVTEKLGDIYKTNTPSFDMAANDLQSYSKEWQYILGQLRSSDVISLDDAKKLITVHHSKNNLNFVWLKIIENSKYFKFKIDSIKRQAEYCKAYIYWDSDATKAANKGKKLIIISSKNNFSILKNQVIHSPEQYVSLNFSDPLKREQNLAGIVTIQNVKNPKYIVNGNVIIVYPDSKLAGNLQVDNFSGMKSVDDFKLKTAFSQTLTSEDLKPKVRRMRNGSILPNSIDLKFNFEAFI